MSWSPRQLFFSADSHRRCIRRDLWFDRAKAEHNDIGLEVRLLGEAMRIIGSQKDVVDMPPAAVRRNRAPTGVTREMACSPGLRRCLILVCFFVKVGGSFHGRKQIILLKTQRRRAKGQQLPPVAL